MIVRVFALRLLTSRIIVCPGHREGHNKRADKIDLGTEKLKQDLGEGEEDRKFKNSTDDPAMVEVFDRLVMN